MPSSANSPGSCSCWRSHTATAQGSHGHPYALEARRAASFRCRLRALFSSFDGKLYEVQRKSDYSRLSIGVLSAGGYADAAAQDAAAARADRQRLKNERRALARELQATRTALAAASSPKPAPPRAPPPRPRASSSEDPEDAVVLEMLGIC